MDKPARATLPHPRSLELFNDDTHDSTVDTDGKNRDAARLARGEPFSPDQITMSNASLVNAMPETPDGFAGFDSRPGGNHPTFALRDGYQVIDKGFDAVPIRTRGHEPEEYLARDERESDRRRHRRPERIVEFTPVKR